MFLAINAAVDDSKKEEIVVISDDEDNSDVVYVGTPKKEDGQQSNASGYLGEADSESSSFSVGSPPDYTEYLLLLYSGNGAMLPESLRPPPRDQKTSTPKKNADI